MSPTLSVIIPHKNDVARLDLCLGLLAPQLAPADEVFVVDNGSAEMAPVEAVCRRHRVQLLCCPTGGSYAARNAGLERAGGDVLVLTDSDCQPAPSFVASFRAWFAGQPPLAIAAGPVTLLPVRRGRFNAWECIDLVYGFPQAEMVRRSGTAMTANLAVTRDAVARYGAFDARLYSGGDVEFSRRVSSQVPGGMGWVEEALIFHPTRSTRREHLRRMKRTHEGLERLARCARPGAVSAPRAAWRSELAKPSARWRQIFALEHATLPSKLWAIACLVDLRCARLVYKARLRREADLSALARQYN